MAIRSLKFFFLAILCVFTASCAAQLKPLGLYDEGGLSGLVNGGGYEEKVDTFVVVLDASSTMNEAYGGESKFFIAKDTINLMNRTIPALSYRAGLRTFGQSSNVMIKSTFRVYGMAAYDTGAFNAALEPVTAAGTSPMDKAIDALSKDLGDTVRSAVIIFSDAEGMTGAPLDSAMRLKAELGDRVCIYTVHVGDAAAGRNLMGNIADAGGCGFAVNADEIYSAKGMEEFVTKVLLKKSPPRPVVAPAPPPAPKDSDGDGVIDANDDCPGTPNGAPVNSVGCWIIKGLNFDTARYEIKAAYHASLDELVSVLRRNPALKVEIQGHTDSRGGEAFNQTLSENRAAEVVKYLTARGIDAGRLSSKGYGLFMPVSSNSTEAGRAENRRVEIKPVM